MRRRDFTTGLGAAAWPAGHDGRRRAAKADPVDATVDVEARVLLRKQGLLQDRRDLIGAEPAVRTGTRRAARHSICAPGAR